VRFGVRRARALAVDWEYATRLHQRNERANRRIVTLIPGGEYTELLIFDCRLLIELQSAISNHQSSIHR
jgi:hypothetical protein